MNTSTDQTMNTLTGAQIREILGPELAARAASYGNVYNQVRAGHLQAAIGTLAAGQDNLEIKRLYRSARVRLEALTARKRR